VCRNFPLLLKINILFAVPGKKKNVLFCKTVLVHNTKPGGPRSFFPNYESIVVGRKDRFLSVVDRHFFLPFEGAPQGRVEVQHPVIALSL
jgi:hypothetical protein